MLTQSKTRIRSLKIDFVDDCLNFVDVKMDMKKALSTSESAFFYRDKLSIPYSSNYS